jgi:ABC-type branched-subunit amino acid transport system substrate-binding protein
LRRLAIPAVLAMLALVAAACGGTADRTTTVAEDQATTTTTVVATTSTTAGQQNAIRTGIGVDAERRVIKLGALHDLSGPLAEQVVDVNDAMVTYFDNLNASGGIEGWLIQYVVEDTEDDLDRHVEQYEALRNEVLALTASTGSDTSVRMLPLAKQDTMVFLPLSWYSGWAIPDFDGGLAVEQGTNYCIEAMNVMEFIRDSGGQTIALVTSPDVYGLDAAAGVQLAAAYYGIDIVYNGSGAVISGRDPTEAITGIAGSDADWVYVASDPAGLEALMAGAVEAGYAGMWAGAGPSYSATLLDSPVAQLIDRFFHESVYTVPWGDDAPGNVEMMEAMRKAFPERRPSDAYIIGWNEAATMHQILAEAIAAGDLTRDGVAKAVAAQAGVDFAGSQPNQSYAGLPNDYVTRASAIYKPDLDAYRAAGGADQTLSQADATTGSVLERGFFVSDAAQNLIFGEPCYTPEA